MKSFKHILSFMLLSAALVSPALAAGPAAGGDRQDHQVLRQTVERFLTTQAAGLPGKATVTVGSIDPRLSLAACPVPEAFLPNGSKAWGRTTVGVRCNAPAAWKIFVTASVKVEGEYLAAAVPLSQGHVIQATDVSKIKGDLTALPAGVITDPAQAMGMTVLRSISLGAPLRQDMLRGQNAVQQGQSVKIVSNGPGFRVSTEGKALNNATVGQTAQARIANGQVISGIARAGSMIEVVN